MLNRQDYQDILKILHNACRANGLNDFRESVLSSILEAFRADSGAFFLYDPFSDKNTASNMVSRNLNSKYVSLYQDYFWKHDPVYRVIPETTKSAFRCTDIMSQRDWHMSEYYNNFLRPQNLQWEMHICLKSKYQTLGIISFLKPKASSNFKKKDVIKAMLLSPYISDILQNIISSQRIKILRNDSGKLDFNRTYFKNQYNMTNRESEIVYYVLKGLTNKEIANNLCLSVYTIESHLENIYRKTGVKNRIQLINLFI